MNRENKLFLGIICILISCFGFALMQLFIKLLVGVPTMQKIFFRNLVSAFIAFIPVFKSKISLKGMDRKDVGFIFLRCLFGTFGIILNFKAVEYISLADASMLQKLSPFVVIILSMIFLSEKVKTYQWICVVIAFIGSLFVIKPVGGIISYGAILGLVGAIMAGAAYTTMRNLTIRGVNKSFIVFCFSIFSCVATLQPTIATFQPMNGKEILFIFLLGVSAAIGQFGITFAYSFAPASSISVFEYSQILFASILGYFVLNEVPDGYSLIGYIIIVGVGIYLMFRGKRYVKSNNH